MKKFFCQKDNFTKKEETNSLIKQKICLKSLFRISEIIDFFCGFNNNIKIKKKNNKKQKLTIIDKLHITPFVIQNFLQR